MSLLVRDTYPTVSSINFDPTKQPTAGNVSGGTSNGPGPGTLWYDINGSPQLVSGVGQVGLANSLPSNITAVTNTNPITAPVALMTQVFPAGYLNVVGRTLDIYAAGEYTTDSGSGRTILFSAILSDGTESNTLYSVTTGATTASQTGFAWSFRLRAIVATTGTEANIMSHGTLTILLGGTAAAASTTYADVNTAATADTDLTLANTLTIGQYFGGSNAANTFTQDIMTITISN